LIFRTKTGVVNINASEFNMVSKIGNVYSALGQKSLSLLKQ